MYILEVPDRNIAADGGKHARHPPLVYRLTRALLLSATPGLAAIYQLARYKDRTSAIAHLGSIRSGGSGGAWVPAAARPDHPRPPRRPFVLTGRGDVDVPGRRAVSIHSRRQQKLQQLKRLRSVHCEAAAAANQQQQQQQAYNLPALIRFTHDYALSDDSKCLVLSSLFNHLDLPLAGNITDPDVDFSDPEVKARLFVSVNAFADYLLRNFFMPLKAATNKTPQLSPITHSAVQRAQGSSLPQSLAGTPERLSALRGTCLVRDRHRCVISRKFDVTEALRRRKAAPKDARDDDGSIIEPRDVTTLEVAHILPHSLTKAPDSLLRERLHWTF
ncbi:hypothetical protein GGTG_13739 [Gaeumannomyces tritici R3-111a-1]|uniref:HNH nuclease domain-containing protein n=1 Tax=Gaeumannomyces tritici (strain R3-111a-1) TaxID=644352 RepID=J3PJQ0_GAET3|nr:hypothetical protein GGTG_13739 [Gaeumannomyces tritici R3-111a-1]EJT68692.1 hypothetical protein GGTG_13739 [Gaeumannomyces tritici R3-111a-1]